MRIVDIIIKKRDGLKLNDKEIEFFINGYSKGLIPDYQASALAMAIVLKGMDDEEIFFLTECMRKSGDYVNLNSIDGLKCDKHSTGGVGDKTTLVVAPLVACLGGKVAKLSGRGLGHTGGTLDKLESIDGLKTSLTKEEFIDQINKIGVAVAGQTANLVPADKKLYALRDVTGTVESIPLIASSIMSKKLAVDTDCILLDVKYGSGAFMKTFESAKALSELMVKIGKKFNRDTRAIISDMSKPLGRAIGNILEVKEAIETLKGNGPEDFEYLCLDAAAIMLEQLKIVNDYDLGFKMAKDALNDGRAFNKFVELIKEQGGDINLILHPELFKTSKYIIPIISTRKGYLNEIHCLTIGECAMKLGAGRETLNDVIDMKAGIILKKTIGDYINEGDVLCFLHTDKENIEDIKEEALKAFKIEGNKVTEKKLIEAYIK